MRTALFGFGFLLATLLTATWSAAELVVTVSDQSRELMPGVKIHILQEDINAAKRWTGREPYVRFSEGTTGQDGSFSCLLDRPGSYLAIAKRDGYGIAWMHFYVPGPMPEKVWRHLFLPPEVQISGRVVGEGGQPVADATVGPYLCGPHEPLQRVDGILTTKTEADGGFVLRGIPRGTPVKLVATHPDYATYTGYDATREGPADADRLEGRTIRLSKGFVVSGKVTYGETGIAADGVHITTCEDPDRGCKTVMPSWYETAVADSQGLYSMRLSRAGRIRLEISHPDWPRESWGNAHEITTYASHVEFDIQVKGVVPVRGRFVNAETGETMPGSSIQAIVLSSGRSTPLDVQVDGAFALLYSPNDFFLVQGSCTFGSCSIPFRENLGQAWNLAKSEQVIEITPPILLKGQILRPNGTPAGGAMVVTGFGNRQFAAESTDDGSFVIPLQWCAEPESITRCLEGGPPSALYARIGAYQDDAESCCAGVVSLFWSRQNSVSEDNTAKSLADLDCVITLKPVGVFRGRIIDRSGNGIEGAMVVAHTSAQEPMMRVADPLCSQLTDEDGCYVLRGLEDGARYYVSASTSKWHASSSETCAATVGRTVQLDDIVLPGTRTIAGKVVDEAGNCMGRLSVFAKGRLSQTRSTVTDESGHFTLAGVLGEDLTVKAFNSGRAHLEGAVSLSSSESTATIVVKPVR